MRYILFDRSYIFLYTIYVIILYVNEMIIIYYIIYRIEVYILNSRFVVFFSPLIEDILYSLKIYYFLIYTIYV